MKDFELSLLIARNHPTAGAIVDTWCQLVADGGDPDSCLEGDCSGCDDCDFDDEPTEEWVPK